MTTIAESFLNDLNDLEESSSDDGEQHGNEDFHQQDKMEVVVTEHLRSQQSFRTHMKRIDAALSVSFFLLCDLCVFRGETYILHYDTNLVHESFFFLMKSVSTILRSRMKRIDAALGVRLIFMFSLSVFRGKATQFLSGLGKLYITQCWLFNVSIIYVFQVRRKKSFIVEHIDVKSLFRDHFQHKLTQQQQQQQQQQQTSAPSRLDEQDPEYDLIMKSNDMNARIKDEIVNLHKVLCETYEEKFPELKQLIENPLSYAAVVKRIGNKTDMTDVDFGDHLPQATKMVVTVTASAAAGTTLSDSMFRKAMSLCDEIENLDQDYGKILRFVESRMHALAPNTSTLLGADVTAKLMATAGGLRALSRIPACNLQVVGQNKSKNFAGFSSASTDRHTGIVNECELAQNAPPQFRRKLARVIGAKAALCIRADLVGRDGNNELGITLKDMIAKKIKKWNEKPQAKIKKALPVPDSGPKSKRGGKRVRKFKEKFAMTDVRKAANRVIFGDTTDEYGDSSMGLTLGALGKGGIKGGALRVMTKKERKKEKKLSQKVRRVNMGGSGATSGLASSVAFTPVQGIELINPELQKKRVREANESYFGSDAAFVAKKRKKNNEEEEVS